MAARLFILMTTLFLALAPVSVQAQQTHIKASLVSESLVPSPGKSGWLAVQMMPSSGWHGYWKNPGDAGVGPSFRWTLPKGVTVGEPRFPVPETLIVSGLMNHVYTGEYALLLPLSVAANMPSGQSLPLKVELDWLACTDQICVPEHDSLSLDLKTGDGSVTGENRTRFDGWLQQLPKPLGIDGHFQTDGKRMRVAIPLPASVAVHNPHLFAETEDVLKYVAVQTFWRDGDVLTIESDLSGKGAISEFRGVLEVDKGQGFELNAKPGRVDPGKVAMAGESGADQGLMTIVAALGGAFLGGLLLNIMPCVFPIISLKALSLARAGGDEGRARSEAVAYTAGAVLTSVSLGGILLALRAGGMAVGWAFQLQNPIIIAFLLLLAIAITLNLAGVFHLRNFGGGEALAGQGGLQGSFWTGVLAAFVATPCSGPFMAAALGAALVLPTFAALSIFVGLGLGLAAPFLLIAFVPKFRSKLPKPGAWMRTFQRVLAIPMALTALALAWLLWRQLSPDAVGVRSGTEQSVAFDERRLLALRTAHKPVFLYFTADWCLSCKVNEKAAIERDEVQASFRRKGMTVMVGDWTSGDATITRFLAEQGRSGVPLYLYYPAKGSLPQVLPQVLTPSMLTALN